MKARVVIIGGGVMGASIAMHLADRLDAITDPVILLDRSPELAAGSSGRSGAILRQYYADLEVARMARNSLVTYSSFLMKTARDIGFRGAGALTLAGTRAPEWIDRLKDCVARLQAGGIDIKLVDAAAIRELVPGISVAEDTVGAWEPGAGFVNPVATVEAFAAIARTRGAITRLGVEVQAIKREGDRVTGVETSAGTIDAEQVVVAAGPWSRTLLMNTGAEYPLRALRPEQHFVVMPGTAKPELASGADRSVSDPFGDSEAETGLQIDPLARIDSEVEQRSVAQHVPHPTIIDLELGFYARCDPAKSRSRIGHIEYDNDAVLEDPDAFEEAVGEEIGRWARDVLVDRLPVYGELPDVGSQAALYTMTPDAQALMGSVEGVDGLFVVTGFSGHGFKLAPSIGEGMTQMILGEPVTAFDPEFFNPQRFAGQNPEWGGKFGL